MEMNSLSATDELLSSDHPLVEFHASDIKLPDDQKTWDHFQIGQGGFANVYEVRIEIPDNDSNEKLIKPAALKRFKWDRNVKNESAKNAQLEKLKREARVVNEMSHPNIIKLFGVCYDDQFFGLLLELCEGGSLGNVCRSIQKDSTIELRVLANWAHQISSGMKYLTDRHYIHRDLKADNVLVKEHVCFCIESEKSPYDLCPSCHKRPLCKLQLKITDFGLSKNDMSVGDSIVGTLVWLAPEVFRQERGHSNWTEFSDVWSFGVVLWEILAREMPHSDVYPIVVAHWNQEGQTLQLKEEWPQKWKEIMTQCWSLYPPNRPTFDSLVQYFEEYTKGLVEVHISDLPKKKASKQSKTSVIKKYLQNSTKSNSSKVSNRSMKDNNWNSGKRQSQLLGGNKKLMFFGCGFLSILVIIGIAILVFFLSIENEPDKPCSDNYQFLAVTDSCYKTYIPYASHPDALDHCESEGGSLVSIHSDTENNFVTYLYNWTLAKARSEVEGFRENNQVWIGHEYDPYEKTFFWSDGSKNIYQNFDYSKGGESYTGPFVVILPNSQGKWDSANASTLASYTCKRATGSAHKSVKKECSSGFTFIKSTGFCYKTYLDHSTFHEASQKCSSERANLVSIHSSEEHAAVIKLYKTSLQEKYKERSFILLAYLWTGLTYNGSSWSWSDGSKLDWNNYQDDDWKTPRTGENWTAISLGTSKPQATINDKWITVGDPNYFAFVCKKPDTSVTPSDTPTLPGSSTTTTPSTDIIQNSKNCSKGYKFFEMTEYCYKFNLKPANFTLANNNCQKENGQLASIHSKDEDQFILNLAKELLGTDEEHQLEFYIGLIYQNNRWEWTDESPVDYVNWNSVEPNFLFLEKWTSMTYTVLKDHSLLHGWNNMQNFQERSYFCKKSAE